MSNQMKVTMLLADSAQAVEGKLFILGGGWSMLGPEPSPIAIAVKVEVPWSDANAKHELRIELVNEDGNAVSIETPIGEQNVEIRAPFEVGRPPGLPHGTPLDLCLAVNLGAIPLEPGRRYAFMLYIDDETKEDWRLGFLTRPANK